jgi:pimeloyl-ACP methyl ester carboxylesterase
MPDDPRATQAPGPYGPQGRSAWMDVDWREHQRWVQTSEGPVNAIDLGTPDDPTPFVWVHGLSGSWQNWLENLPHFARHHRCIAFDLPGFGASPMPRSREITIKGYGRLVAELLDRMGVPGAAVVVGNSMGGFISAELAIAEPERVERLVLVSAAGLTVEHQRFEPGLAALRRTEAVLAWYGGQIAKRSDWLTSRPRLRKLALGFVLAHPDRLPAPLLAEQVRGTGKPGFVAALDALTNYPIRDRLPDIACPTLIVWGTRDRLVPVRDAWEFERLIPDSRAVVWRDTGHVPQLERPVAFNDLVEAFEAERPQVSAA